MNQPIEVTLHPHQLLVLAFLDHLTLLQHHYPITMLDC
jgi:hypothetical protein